jgi:hypothetical protein
MVGFRIVLPDANVLDVPEADEYDVADDGALVLRADGKELVRLPVDGWVDVRALEPRPLPDVALLLSELCLRLGVCLPPDARVRLQALPPRDVDGFTDAVLIAEGLDPPLHKGLRSRVREMVVRHFDAGGGVCPGEEG